MNYPNAYRLREKLCSDGTIINGVFQNDYEFDSISLAVSLILGRNARGQKEWVDINGFPFDENEKTIMLVCLTSTMKVHMEYLRLVR